VSPWGKLTLFFSPLSPGTCFATELKFLPLVVGSLRLESVRLIDANSGETTDIRDLPDILCLGQNV
jgi:hypothetical protein